MGPERLKTYIVIFALLLCSSAQASNTGGVFGPAVNDGHRSIQYRNAYDPDNHNFTQRLHYQQATSDKLMYRGIVQTRKTADSINDFDFFQAELFWQFDDVTPNWQQGLRFDVRLRSENRPDQIGLNWMHDVNLSPTLLARFLVLTSAEFGSNARSGINLQARGSLNYAMSQNWTMSLELFSNLGTTGRFNGLSNQSQQIGPAVIGNIGKWQLFTGILLGATSASPDESFRFWLTRSF